MSIKKLIKKTTFLLNKKLLIIAANPVPTIFGRVESPSGPGTFADPLKTLGSLFANFIRLVFLGGALMAMIYLFWGAFDWLVAGGDKESVEKARLKITNAVIGMLLIVVGFVAFGVVTGDMLGIIKKQNGNWIFTIPTVNKCIRGGEGFDPASSKPPPSSQ